MKNEIKKFRHLACIQKENRNAVAYARHDVAIILRQLKLKKSQSINTFHNEQKKFSKAKGKTKPNHEALGLWQCSLLRHDVIAF